MRVRWMIGIAEGLQRLHDLRPRPVIHRDLKASNVLLSGPQPSTAIRKVPFRASQEENGVHLTAVFWTCKVADFGIAEMMETLATRTSAAGAGAAASGGAGTLAWKAPETFAGSAFANHPLALVSSFLVA